MQSLRSGVVLLQSQRKELEEPKGSHEIGKERHHEISVTSAGIKNTSIHDALVDLLGKPIAEANALCIPTATYAIPGGVGHAWRFISGREPICPMCELGWKSLYYFAMLLKETKQLIGSIGYTVITKTENGKLVNLGYFLKHEYWGKGYTIEAAKKVTEFAFITDNKEVGSSGLASQWDSR